MRPIEVDMLLALALSAVLAPAAPAATVARTLRLDYFHTGRSGFEAFALDGLVLEGSWPGNPRRPLDDTNLGTYYFEVVDRATNRTVFSRGFASAYGEWETTEEAKTAYRTFHESLRFPLPAAKAQVVVKRRDPQGLFREVWSVPVDPDDPVIDRSEAPRAKGWAVLESGPPATKVDLVLLGDGYTADEMDKWHRDARRMADLLFAVSPFKERRSDFNVWAVDTPSAESGIARPSDGVSRRSALRATYDAFGSERYVLDFDNKRVREAAAAVPYEATIIVVNDRKYGGGGILGLYATVAADNAFTPYVLVHEFAHHFAGLADEYYTSDVAYEARTARPEPWEPNVTASATSPRWKDLLTPGTPLPTPWAKAEFEAEQKEIQARRRKLRAEGRPEEEMETLFREEQEKDDALLSKGEFKDAVGAFEGAMYEASGYYRPEANCMMFTRNARFCAVCRRAIERIIDLDTGPAR
jgi:hypothetical protein